jgi:hypothetical protein
LGGDLSGDSVLTSPQPSELWIGGNLWHSVGTQLNAFVIGIGPKDFKGLRDLDIDGSYLRDPNEFRPPCACNDSSILNVESLVRWATVYNHNAAASAEEGFDSSRLENVSSDTIELPCGQIFVPSITVSGELVLRVRGRTALFVEKDLISEGKFSLEMAPDAKLDMFIGGDLSLSGGQTVGTLLGEQTVDSYARPANLRVYVGQNVKLAGATTFIGNLYAPRADVKFVGVQSVCGAIFAREFVSSSSKTTILYDTSVLRAGDDCYPQPLTCKSNDDCVGTLACIDGECSACRNDEDCGPPLICSDGECTAILL